MRVRDAMVPDPAALGTDSTAEDAGRLLAKPEVRAVFVCEGERLVGVVTRKTLVREVVAKGLDPGKTALREIAEEPHYTIESSLRLDEAFHFLEEHDAEGRRGRALAAGIRARRRVALDRLGQRSSLERDRVQEVVLARLDLAEPVPAEDRAQEGGAGDDDGGPLGLQ